MHRLLLLIVSYSSLRFLHSFAFFCFLFSSDWMLLNDLLSTSPILSILWSSLFLLSIAFFISFIAFFSSRIPIWYTYMYIEKVQQIRCSWFLIFFYCLLFVQLSFVDSYSSLRSLKTTIRPSILSGKLQISISVGLVTRKFCVPLVCHVFDDLHCSLHIWRSLCLLQSLLTGFRRETPLSALLGILRLRLYAFSRPCKARLNADSLPFTFPPAMLNAQACVLSFSPMELSQLFCSLTSLLKKLAPAALEGKCTT